MESNLTKNRFRMRQTNLKENETSSVDKFKALYPISEWEKLGYFTEEYILKINDHWYQFSPPNPESFYSLAVLYVFIMCIGISGNLLVILTFFRRKSLRTSANVLIVNLAVSDCLMMCKMPIFIYNSFYKGPVLGDIACRLYGFVGGLTGTVSICTLTSISLDRFFVIKYPLQRQYQKLRIKICLVTSWIYGIIFSSLPAFDIGLGRYNPEGYLTSCSFDYLSEDNIEKIFILIYFVAAWVIPVVIITFSYTHIVIVVAKRSVESKTGKESFRHVKEQDKHRQEVKLAVIVLFVIFLWFIAWTPYAVIALLGIFGKKEWITPLSSMIPALLCKTASAIDPFVYALSHPKFKQEVRSIFCKKAQQIPKEESKVWTMQTNKIHKSFTEVSNLQIEEDVVEVSLGSIPNYGEVSVAEFK